MRALVIAVVIALCGVARADDPASVVIVVDRSAAMKGERIELVRAAVRDAIENAPDGERIAVVAFAKRANVIVPLGNNDAKRIEPAIARLDTDASFDENMGAGLDLARSLMQGKGVRHVVLISNTEATIATRHAVEVLRERGISLATIAVQADAHAALVDLGRRGRGGGFAVDDLVELRRALSDASAPPPVAQKRTPLDVVFVLDRSFSMDGTALEGSKQAIRTAIATLDADDLVSVVAFDSEAAVLVKPTFARDRTQIGNALARVGAQGGTNIFTGLKSAFDLLEAENRREKRVVLVTDGGGASDGIADLSDFMHGRSIRIDTVGIPGADRNLLTQIAINTGGRLFMLDDYKVWPQLLGD